MALHAQGFTQSAPSGRIDARHFRRAVRPVGVVQLDSVNVLARAHYMPFFSRLGPYDRDALDGWLWRSGEMVEYWAHAASLVPVEHRHLFVHRMRSAKPWDSVRRLQTERPGFIESVLEEVRRRGPVTLAELDADSKNSEPWWGWRLEKHALEWLFVTGRLSVADRVNFAKAYDLPERVHSAEILGAEAPDVESAQRELLLKAARSLGVGMVQDLADYYRIKPSTARPLLDGALRRGDLQPVEVAGWDGPVYLHPEATLPRHVEGGALLSPFDPLVWFRDRVERLFGFHYRIEIYVPAKDREFGYYVLPFLLDGELVGRVDLKADRKRGRLLVKGAFSEDGQDRRRVSGALATELHRIAEWLDLDETVIDDHGDLAPELHKVI